MVQMSGGYKNRSGFFKLKCRGCGRIVMIPRKAFEKKREKSYKVKIIEQSCMKIENCKSVPIFV